MSASSRRSAFFVTSGTWRISSENGLAPQNRPHTISGRCGPRIVSSVSSSGAAGGGSRTGFARRPRDETSRARAASAPVSPRWRGGTDRSGRRTRATPAWAAHRGCSPRACAAASRPVSEGAGRDRRRRAHERAAARGDLGVERSAPRSGRGASGGSTSVPSPWGTDGASAWTTSWAMTRPSATPRDRAAHGSPADPGSGTRPREARRPGRWIHTNGSDVEGRGRRPENRGPVLARGGAVEEDDAHLPRAGQLAGVAAAPRDRDAHRPQEALRLGAGQGLEPGGRPRRVRPDETHLGRRHPGLRLRGDRARRSEEALEVRRGPLLRDGSGAQDGSQGHDGETGSCRHRPSLRPPERLLVRLVSWASGRAGASGSCVS